MKVVQLIIPIDKMKDAVSFYADGLGLKPDDGAEYKAFVVGNQRIELVPAADEPRQLRPYLRFHVHGLRECITYLVVSGYIPRGYLLHESATSIDIADPGGNRRGQRE